MSGEPRVSFFISRVRVATSCMCRLSSFWLGPNRVDIIDHIGRGLGTDHVV
jgi:hypothetical protein